MIDDMHRPRPAGQSPQRPMPQYQPRPFVTRPAFRTPQQAAAQDSEGSEETIDMRGGPGAAQGSGAGGKPPKKHRRSLKEWLKSRTKKQWAIIIIVAVLVLGGGGVGAYFLFFQKDAPPKVATVKQKPKAVPVPTTVPSTLTGLQVDKAVNERPVTAVMIENSVDSRPQSSLDQAGVVFEAIAEGGITRFCVIYQDTEPAYIGPVRSVRPYYIQWAMGFDAAIAHVGGSGEALQNIREWGTKDIDQFSNGAYFQRISSRAAPHNVYTSMTQLREIENKRGYGKANYTGFTRKKEQPSKTPNATTIDVNISGPTYSSNYIYDIPTNTYKRNQAGQPHMQVDQNGAQTQIAPKVVIAMTLSQGIASDGTHTAYGALGSGHVYIFQDGTVTEGTWTKNSRGENITFKDASGKPIALNPGQTWITAVGDNSRVTYR